MVRDQPSVMRRVFRCEDCEDFCEDCGCCDDSLKQTVPGCCGRESECEVRCFDGCSICSAASPYMKLIYRR